MNISQTRTVLEFQYRGVYSSIIPPNYESKGLRAREENQRRVERNGRAGGKKRKTSVG